MENVPSRPCPLFIWMRDIERYGRRPDQVVAPDPSGILSAGILQLNRTIVTCEQPR
jgi:hypothetical protein